MHLCTCASLKSLRRVAYKPELTNAKQDKLIYLQRHGCILTIESFTGQASSMNIRGFFGRVLSKDMRFERQPLCKPLPPQVCPTFRRGLSLVSIMKSYLQSSQHRVSELLIHWWRQDWWTKRKVPVQRQGVMSGLSSSPSQ